MAATWQDLGEAAGSVTVGLTRIAIDPGKWSTPAHQEGSEEEIFFVLGGSGVSWQFDGEAPAAYQVRRGDCLVHLALAEAHTLKAGPDGLDVLAFGMRAYADAATHLPRAGVSWLGETYVVTGSREGHPWAHEAAAGEPEFGDVYERPPTIVNLDDVEAEETARTTVVGTHRDLGRAAGSLRTGLQHVVAAPGRLAAPPHCHGAEEELFVVLDGHGTLVLGDEEHPLRPGALVSRPAGTRVAHALRAGDEPLTYLAYGTRDPNDITYYPRSDKLNFRGVGVITGVERLGYWDGED